MPREEDYFSPNKLIEYKVAQVIRQARKTVDIAIFSFTNQLIYEAVAFAHSRGCKVRIVADYG